MPVSRINPSVPTAWELSEHSGVSGLQICAPGSRAGLGQGGPTGAEEKGVLSCTEHLKLSSACSMEVNPFCAFFNPTFTAQSGENVAQLGKICW